jgi:RNA polymerase sigma factor (sigma-70 family)
VSQDDPQRCHQNFIEEPDKGAGDMMCSEWKDIQVSSADHLAAVTVAACECDPAERCAHRRGVELNHLAVRYYDSLVRFFKRRSSSVEDAADLAQDTFVRLSTTDLGQIRKPASFLFTTALNLLRDRARSSQARHAALSIPAEEAQLVCPAPHPERILEGEQRLRALEEALLELSPKCRAVFVLFHFDEMTQREIADRLRISVSMVEKYVKQAVSHCEARLKELSAESLNGGGAK